MSGSPPTGCPACRTGVATSCSERVMAARSPWPQALRGARAEATPRSEEDPRPLIPPPGMPPPLLSSCPTGTSGTGPSAGEQARHQPGLGPHCPAGQALRRATCCCHTVSAGRARSEDPMGTRTAAFPLSAWSRPMSWPHGQPRAGGAGVEGTMQDAGAQAGGGGGHGGCAPALPAQLQWGWKWARARRCQGNRAADTGPAQRNPSIFSLPATFR